MVTKESDRPIIEWTEGFKRLYKKSDEGRSPEEFWNAAMAHISKIGEAIRRTNYPDIVEAAVHSFVWINGYIGRCNDLKEDVFSIENSLSQIVAFKYPDCCGHCLENICKCRPVIIDKQKDKSAKYDDLFEFWEKHPDYANYSLNRWLNTFWSIFSGQIHMSSIESIGFHLLEEAGEEAMAVRELVQFRGILSYEIEGLNADFLSRISSIPNIVEEYKNVIQEIKPITGKESEKEALEHIDFTSNDPLMIKARLVKGKMNFIVEVADTFSWFCSVLLKLRNCIIEHLEFENDGNIKFNLEERLKEIYGSQTPSDELKCYKCKKSICECRFFPLKKDKND